MWLINTTTIELKLVPSYRADVDSSSGPSRPPYAILSHRWREDEVTFQDMQHERRSKRKGWKKLSNCCSQAKSDGLGYVWIDTCCINKDSDAELTEAINSMYSWYKDAEVCYLYIDDLGPDSSKSFKEAEIWQRGWCLQELIAPQRLVCFNDVWSIIGDRTQLRVKIAAAAGIDVQLLAGTRGLSTYSVAQRMSWAAKRKTTRPEDSSYCLLGIFDVNMPLIYGEGAEKAFLRLQGEIIKSSDDHSIFAWPGASFPENCSLLARSILFFASCGNIRSISTRRGRKPFSITNRGVSITLKMLPWSADTYLAVLNCTAEKRQKEEAKMLGDVGILLRRMYEDDSYIRVSCDGKDILLNVNEVLSDNEEWWVGIDSIRPVDRHVYVIQSRLTQDLIRQYTPRLYGFKIGSQLMEFCKGFDGEPAVYPGPECAFSASDSLLVRRQGCLYGGVFAQLNMTGDHDTIHKMSLYMDDDFNPVCFLAESSASNFISAANGTSRTSNLTIEELARCKSFEQRSVTDELGWNEVRRGENGQVLIRQNTLREGLWQIRGDREDGIDAFLDYDTFRTGQYIHLKIKRRRLDTGLESWHVQMSSQLMTDSSRFNSAAPKATVRRTPSVCPATGSGEE